MTLTEFLLARIAEDEALANNAVAPRFATHVGGPQWNYPADNPSGAICVGNLVIAQASSYDYNTDNTAGADGGRFARHIVNWDPARVLAECEAKRQVLKFCSMVDDWQDEYAVGLRDEVLSALALSYVGHTEYPGAIKP